MSSYYGLRKDPFNKQIEFHPGIDFYSLQKTTYIYSADSGKVVHAGNLKDYGKLVIVEHIINETTIRTYYGHLRKIFVSKNQIINKGQLIGLMGSSGRSTGVHLHYEIRIFDNNSLTWIIVNPNLLI